MILDSESQEREEREIVENDGYGIRNTDVRVKKNALVRSQTWVVLSPSSAINLYLQ